MARAFSRADTLLWLQHLDIFTDVPAEELALLLDDTAWIELRSGDLLAADDDDRHVFIIRYGSLCPTLMGPRGTMELAPLGPGEMLGEISVIAGIPRPTEIVALRHSGLLRVDGAAFRRFLERSHRGTLQVTQHLARSLARNLVPRTRAIRPGSVALVAVAEGIDLMAIGRAIVAEASRHSLAAELLSNAESALNAAEVSASQMLNDLTVLVTSGVDAAWDALCISAADRLLYVDATGHAARAEPHLERILGTGRAVQIDAVTLVPDGGTPAPPVRWRDRAGIALHLNIRAGRAEDIAFLSRVLGGRAVGLVLAGGGARGFAHLGVIRAWREAGLPIDLVGGTSMGAIIGAGTAFEWSHEELIERMHHVFAHDSPVNDYTLPVIALTRGRKVATRLRHHFGDARIESTWRPFFAVSTDLSACRPFIHRQGLVWRALRASSALPGILPPMIEDGHVLVDGAIMNNFPVDIMRDMRRGPVVGVGMPLDEDYASAVGDFEAMNAFSRLANRGKHPVNVFSVLNRTATASSLTHSQDARSLADLVIDPSVRHVRLLNWKSLEQTAEAAYRETASLIEREGISYESLLRATAPPG